MTRGKQENKFTNDEEVLDAFLYLAQDVVIHPLVISPKVMTFKILFTPDGPTQLSWANPETAPWIELATYVRKLAVLENDSTNLDKVLIIIGKTYETLRPDVQALQRKTAEWRGSNKTQYLASEADGSLSIRSNAEAAELVINGSLFHANANLLRIWRGLSEFEQSYCVACAQDWIVMAGLLIKETAALVQRAVSISDIRPDAPTVPTAVSSV